ncbi:MAG TPA: DUF397 domain-containing protein [Streptosporangiaceae bacterium]|nr:DUF397 domain-containing protein [Streptosporangiaceae bacterium]
MNILDSEAARWRKSSHSGSEGGTCVELADLSATVGIRDSKDPDGPGLVVSRRELGSFVARIKSGDLDL